MWLNGMYGPSSSDWCVCAYLLVGLVAPRGPALVDLRRARFATFLLQTALADLGRASIGCLVGVVAVSMAACACLMVCSSVTFCCCLGVVRGQNHVSLGISGG